MKPAQVRENTSECEYNYKKCLKLCGMCPSCVFAPKPPGSTQLQWKVSNEFKRKFAVALLLRCKDEHLLENIQRQLSVTSWGWFKYARSRSPISPREYPTNSPPTKCDGKPLGMDTDEIWRWFNCSPAWMKSCYLSRIFSLCDIELLRMLCNLTSVLLVRQKRGFRPFGVSNPNKNKRALDTEHPALMVVPGSSKSVSGVSQYKDFISFLPVDLSKRILGLLQEQTLRRCRRVCRCWKQLSEETIQEMKFRKIFQEQIQTIVEGCCSNDKVSPTYANIVELTVPVRDDEEEDGHPAEQRVKPFANAKIKTKTVQMEERNVYCGGYFTKTLLDEEDSQRVLDYRGGPLMATGLKDRLVHLLYMASGIKTVASLRGHVGSIRAVLLCEDRDLLLSAGCDASIRGWSLKTYRCEMVLYGHTDTVNCLDIHDDKIVSGSKDHTVKVWSLQTWRPFKNLNFKHQSSVHCVKIDKRTVYSSCGRGVVKIWSMETASLLRTIDGHKSSVKCLFFNEWYLLSGDSSGKVMAWSVSCDTEECLKTFNHPSEVRSLTLMYLRVVTGCADGKIRIFNFLTGDCLREMIAESESSSIMSLHFYDQSILVNTTCSVLLLQFAKVFWDYTGSTQKNRMKVVDQDSLIFESPKRAQSSNQFRKSGKSCVSIGGGDMISNTQKIQKHTLKSQIKPTITKSQTKECAQSEKALLSLMQSEKATGERMKKRGPHHRLSRDSILLRVGAMQRMLRMDEVSINMESNARLRDSWGPPDAQKQQAQTQLPLAHGGRHRRPNTCVPILKKASRENGTSTARTRDVSTAPDAAKRYFPIKRAHSRSEDAKAGLQIPNPKPSLPALHPFGGWEEKSPQCASENELLHE
ncbi:unnamed protein product [Menidia menidia]|uniref:(Atlantic silverside) hypothetical protein n=1 Tax=Menidia menidia TaxID=238744 RepID=A0A8S4AZZ9_9TELE|nr:unnamed protein product [Menidia menidia]